MPVDLRWRGPAAASNGQSDGVEGLAELADVELMSPIERIEVRDDGDDIHVGGQEARRMPRCGAGQGVGELVRSRRNRELVGGEPDHRGRIGNAPSTRRPCIASRRDDSYRRSGPPGAPDHSPDGGGHLVERPSDLEISAIEGGGLGCVDLCTSTVADHPGPNDRRPPMRSRPRSARSAAALPAIQPPTSAPAELRRGANLPELRCDELIDLLNPLDPGKRSTRSVDCHRVVEVASADTRTSSNDLATRSA